MVGPALGYVIGGQFLEIHADFYSLKNTPNISSKDSGWIGAWWLGFIFAWALSWACAIFLFLYPAVLPKHGPSHTKNVSSSKNIEDQKSKKYYKSRELLKMQSDIDTEISVSSITKSGIRDIITEAGNKISQLFNNPSYILLVLGGALDSIMVIGLATFLPKFIMSQYGFTASVSAIIMGIIITPSGGLGTLTGGYLVKRLEMSREQILKMYIYCQIIAIPCLFAFVFYCKDVKFAGVNVSYPNNVLNKIQYVQSINFTVECNSNCGQCGGVEKYEPVCGENGLVYLNSCYAGCKEFSHADNSSEPIYNKCQCISETIKLTGEGGSGSGQMKMCNVECQKYFFTFVSLLFLIIWFSLMSGMTCITCIMRFVEPENKSLGMGIAFIIARYVSCNNCM